MENQWTGKEIKEENTVIEIDEFKMWTENQKYSTKKLLKFVEDYVRDDWETAVIFQIILTRIKLGKLDPTEINFHPVSVLDKKFEGSSGEPASPTPIEHYLTANWKKFKETGIFELAPNAKEELEQRFLDHYRNDSNEEIKKEIKLMKDKSSVYYDLKGVIHLEKILENRK